MLKITGIGFVVSEFEFAIVSCIENLGRTFDETYGQSNALRGGGGWG